MKNLIYGAISAAILLGSQTLLAEEDMEKCSPMKNGKNIIKANKADCKTANHSCAGQNSAGEPDAFIIVPKGQCEQINKGDFTKVQPSVKDRLEMS